MGGRSGFPVSFLNRRELPAQPEPGDERPVPLDVVPPEVVQQATSPTDEHEQPATRVMVLLVGPQVLGELPDALGEDGNLDLG